MGVAAGFAAAGKIPFASTFAVFAIGRATIKLEIQLGILI
jgi:transketolase